MCLAICDKLPHAWSLTIGSMSVAEYWITMNVRTKRCEWVGTTSTNRDIWFSSHVLAVSAWWLHLGIAERRVIQHNLKIMREKMECWKCMWAHGSVVNAVIIMHAPAVFVFFVFFIPCKFRWDTYAPILILRDPRCTWNMRSFAHSP